MAEINSSWAVRVNRDELVEFQVDGTAGGVSQVAGLRDCRVQHRSATPKPVWDPDIPATYSFRDQWQEIPEGERRVRQRLQGAVGAVLRAPCTPTPLPLGPPRQHHGVQLAELGLRSSAEGRRLDVPEISL